MKVHYCDWCKMPIEGDIKTWYIVEHKYNNRAYIIPTIKLEHHEKCWEEAKAWFEKITGGKFTE